MNFGLTAEQEMVVATVRGFVETELFPLEAEVERRNEVPREIGRAIQDKVIALGFYAPNMPADLGGGGLDTLTLTLLERELGRASLALANYWHGPRRSCSRVWVSSAKGTCFQASAARRSTRLR